MPNPNFKDFLLLYDQFGPEAQAKQKFAQLQQLASVLEIAGAAQRLQSAPARQALEMRGLEADVTGREQGTRLAGERAPLELEGLREGVAGARTSREGQVTSNAAAKLGLKSQREMAPLARQKAQQDVAAGEFEATQRGPRAKLEEEAIRSDINFKKQRGGADVQTAEAQQLESLFRVLPQLQILLQQPNMPKDMLPQFNSAAQADLMKLPAIAVVLRALEARRGQAAEQAVKDATESPQGLPFSPFRQMF